jgi:hypothetical protein
MALVGGHVGWPFILRVPLREPLAHPRTWTQSKQRLIRNGNRLIRNGNRRRNELQREGVDLSRIPRAELDAAAGPT